MTILPNSKIYPGIADQVTEDREESFQDCRISENNEPQPFRAWRLGCIIAGKYWFRAFRLPRQSLFWADLDRLPSSARQRGGAHEWHAKIRSSLW